MWTGDGKVFFFNPTSKTSIWERPKELEDVETVDEILKQGPKGKIMISEPVKVEAVVEKVIAVETTPSMFIILLINNNLLTWLKLFHSRPPPPPPPPPLL